jgi:hypothetical protein
MEWGGTKSDCVVDLSLLASSLKDVIEANLFLFANIWKFYQNQVNLVQDQLRWSLTLKST